MNFIVRMKGFCLPAHFSPILFLIQSAKCHWVFRLSVAVFLLFCSYSRLLSNRVVRVRVLGMALVFVCLPIFNRIEWTIRLIWHTVWRIPQRFTVQLFPPFVAYIANNPNTLAHTHTQYVYSNTIVSHTQWHDKFCQFRWVAAAVLQLCRESEFVYNAHNFRLNAMKDNDNDHNQTTLYSLRFEYIEWRPRLSR